MPSSHDRNVRHKGCNIRTLLRHSRPWPGRPRRPSASSPPSRCSPPGPTSPSHWPSSPAASGSTSRPGTPSSPAWSPPAGCCGTPPARPTGWGPRWWRSGAPRRRRSPRSTSPGPPWSSSAASSPPPAPRSAWARDEVTVLDQIDDPRAGANAFRVGRVVPAPSAARRGSARLGAGLGARRVACARCPPTPAPITPRRSWPPTTAGSRWRSAPPRSRARARAGQPPRRRRVGARHPRPPRRRARDPRRVPRPPARARPRVRGQRGQRAGVRPHRSGHAGALADRLRPSTARRRGLAAGDASGRRHPPLTDALGGRSRTSVS